MTLNVLMNFMMVDLVAAVAKITWNKEIAIEVMKIESNKTQTYPQEVTLLDFLGMKRKQKSGQ